MQVEMVHVPKVTDAHRRACALLAQEAFRTQRISHHSHSKMPHRGQKVPIRVPSSIKDGYYFLTSREYRSKDGVLYNYELYNKHGLRLKPQTRGKRKMLCFFFPRKSGPAKPKDMHRVFAFNYKKCNWERPPLLWSSTVHVHHRPKPKRRPWKNCTWQNMSVMTEVVHAQWHQRHG